MCNLDGVEFLEAPPAKQPTPQPPKVTMAGCLQTRALAHVCLPSLSHIRHNDRRRPLPPPRPPAGASAAPSPTTAPSSSAPSLPQQQQQI